ncbi:MAG: ycnJ 2 [Thermoleophilia bacterium]|nr:ycnJ 2 [Thermoleophilia bacterium]
MTLMCAAGLLLLTASNARAHAAFKSVTPADGATLKTLPASVVVEFTKDIDDNVREAALLPPTGKSIDDAWKVDGAKITITTPKKMANGTWGVKWRVLGGDGHPLTGSSTFKVATATEATPAEPAEPAETSTPAPTAPATPASAGHGGHVMASTYPHTGLERLALAGRILFFGGLLLFVGGVIFAIVAAPGWRPRYWNATLSAVVVGSWIVLGTHVAMLDERSLLEMLNPMVWFSGMFTVACRGYMLATIIILLIHAFRFHLEPVEWEARGAAHPKLLVGLVIAAAAAPALSGHAADGTLLWLRIPIDMLHVLAGAAWLGGLVQMMTIIVRERSLDPRISKVVHRYAKLAATSVGVLVVTGIYATLNELDAGIGELFGSTWGRLVLLKALLLAATMPLANVNRLRNVPDIGHDPIQGVPRLRRFVALELVIVIWVVGATAMLVYETPPTTPTTTQATAAE